MVAWKKSAKIYAIRYFSRTLSFVPNVSDESLVETTFKFKVFLGYYQQFVIISNSYNYFFYLNLH